jgi:hypothetical protein
VGGDSIPPTAGATVDAATALAVEAPANDVALFADDWRIVCASVAGPNHDRNAVPNEDAFVTAALPDGGHVFAVADGAGSVSHAAHGSRIAVDAAVDAAKLVFIADLVRSNAWWTETAAATYSAACLTGFQHRVRADVSARSSQRVPGVTPAASQYSSTLLALVAYPPFFCFFSVGDCFLVLDREPGGPALVVAPPASDSPQNVTTFLTSAHVGDDLQAGVIVDDAVRGVALCTDGMYEGMLAVELDHNGVARPMAPPEFRNYFTFFADGTVEATELSRKLTSREFARTSGDDKTMILAVRR